MVRPGQYRNGRVNSHGRYSLRSVLCHRQNTGLQFFIGIAERLLHALPFLIAEFRYTLVGYLQILQRHQPAVKPLSVRTCRGIFLFHLIIVNDSSLYGIHQKHLTRMQSLLHQDPGWINIKYTHFGGQNQRIIVRDQITGRT